MKKMYNTLENPSLEGNLRRLQKWGFAVIMAKKHVIYKKDNWNMLTVEARGRELVLREISDQWGEDCHTFLSRPELMEWVSKRFPKSDFEGNEAEWEEIIAAFKAI